MILIEFQHANVGLFYLVIWTKYHTNDFLNFNLASFLRPLQHTVIKQHFALCLKIQCLRILPSHFFQFLRVSVFQSLRVYESQSLSVSMYNFIESQYLKVSLSQCKCVSQSFSVSDRIYFWTKIEALFHCAKTQLRFCSNFEREL